MPSSTLPRAIASVALLDIPAIPMQPKPFSLPAQPIVAASSNGYLPSGWNVTPKGEFTFALPLEVPPGRAGIAPALSLDYSSGTGNGIAGVGWSVSGFSTITRGGRVWARDGQSDGVDYTARDRFFLDGQELVGIDGAPYGGNGAEYRTANDTFVRVRSISAKALDASGPEAFTVELGDGHIRTYAPVASEQIVFDNDNKAFAHGSLRVEWRLESEADASGNTISYTYQTNLGLGGSNPADYWYEDGANGDPLHGEPDERAADPWQSGSPAADCRLRTRITSGCEQRVARWRAAPPQSSAEDDPDGGAESDGKSARVAVQPCL